MPRIYSNRDRPYDMGHLPVELLARDAAAPEAEARMPEDSARAAADSIAAAIPEYRELCAKYLDGEVAPAKAPVPEDTEHRSRNLKATAYFLDASIAGVCAIEASDWIAKDRPSHTHALVYLIEFGREPKPGEPGDAWIFGTNAARTDLRCAELAVVLAGYVRGLGWSARGHVADGVHAASSASSLVSIERLAQHFV